MINEDWERISLQESIYLHEEQHLFFEEFKNEERKPAIVLNLTKNEHNPSTLRGSDKEKLQFGHDLHAPTDK